MAEIDILGIRHHGPGSCRHVMESLTRIAPDLILLEGPAEAETMLPYIGDEKMVPPVALLGYQLEEPEKAVFYPFAEFSPEWQTLRYAMREGVPVRFFDLPLTHSLAVTPEKCEDSTPDDITTMESRDPFDFLAEAAGYPDGETWWEQIIEQRKDSSDIFEAVKVAVTALRESLPEYTSTHDRIREAWMRRTIRAAQKEDFTRIVVVCGAWHLPALEKMPTVKEDNELLKGLPKVKVACSWIPWTYSRLTLQSGYGAGITAPGWYEYLFHNPTDDGTVWVSKIAEILREHRMDISVAHSVETVRLARATAALRGMPTPSLREFNEAVTTVMGFGNDILLQLVRESLTVGNRLGCVPEEVPKVPLLVDVERLQKRLRVPFQEATRTLTLDLRKEYDLERSTLFHRLLLIGIMWAREQEGKGDGTFKEVWCLKYEPEQIVSIIEMAIWGNTLEEAAKKYTIHQMGTIQDMASLTELLKRVIPSDLPEIVASMITRLNTLSAASTDITEMLKTIPDLVSIVRYGEVRRLDLSMVGHMLRSMMARILAGGVLICSDIDDDHASELLDLVSKTHYAVATLNDEEMCNTWYEFASALHKSHLVHPLLTGYATRLLYDRRYISPQEMQRTLSFHSSVGHPPANTAQWLEGFLHASGSLLLLDNALWTPVNEWIRELPDDAFIELLPTIRRTFSNFTPAERRKLGEKAKNFELQGNTTHEKQEIAFHEADAARVFPLINRLLGIE